MFVIGKRSTLLLIVGCSTTVLCALIFFGLQLNSKLNAQVDLTNASLHDQTREVADLQRNIMQLILALENDFISNTTEIEQKQADITAQVDRDYTDGYIVAIGRVQQSWHTLQLEFDLWLQNPADAVIRDHIVNELGLSEQTLNAAIVAQEATRIQSLNESIQQTQSLYANLQLAGWALTMFIFLGVLFVRQMYQELRDSSESLHASETQLRTLIELIPDALVEIDRNGIITSYQPGAEHASTLRNMPIVGKSIETLFTPVKSKHLLSTLHSAIDTNTMQTAEYTVLNSAGDSFYYEARFLPWANNSAQALVRNITERVTQEEKVRQTQKLESIGLLAGGIAHDFNNLLTGMMAQTSLALRRLPDHNPVRKNIKKAVVSAERAADLTRQLLAYAGKGSFAIEVLDLNHLIHENYELFKTALPANAEISLDLCDTSMFVEADRGQLQQVVMNLIINASEAIQADGRIHVLTRHVTLRPDQQPKQVIQGTELAPGSYIRFEVHDTGCGMSAETMQRIFDPFFSTKQTGRGLGLSATLGIIHACGGALQLFSTPDQGTDFIIWLPEHQPHLSILTQPYRTNNAITV